MKYCNKCNYYKPLTDFHLKKSSKDGYNNKCKICVKNQNTLYYINNKEKKICYASDYQKQDKIKQYQSEYKKIYFKTYYQKNKKSILEYGNAYTQKRYNNDFEFKLTKVLRNRFYNAMIKDYKIQSVLDLIGCSVEECKQFLFQKFKPGMTWENHGEIWEIDHIKSCSSFDLTKLEEQQKCFHYTNLQPLFINENRKKYNK